MALFTVQARVKEVGVRKIMAASMGNVIVHMANSFLQMLVLVVPCLLLIGSQLWRTAPLNPPLPPGTGVWLFSKTPFCSLFG